MKSKFVFYSGSADKPPGTNTKTGEYLRPGDNFSELASIKDWRQVLSNFYPCLFSFDEKHFSSAEHAWHYAKFKSIERPEALLFTLESKSELSKQSALVAKQQGRKLYHMSPSEISFWEQNKLPFINEILYSKFNQCSLAKQVLLATHNAELWHTLPRSKIQEHWTHLEHIRKTLWEAYQSVE